MVREVNETKRLYSELPNSVQKMFDPFKETHQDFRRAVLNRSFRWPQDQDRKYMSFHQALTLYELVNGFYEELDFCRHVVEEDMNNGEARELEHDMWGRFGDRGELIGIPREVWVQYTDVSWSRL